MNRFLQYFLLIITVIILTFSNLIGNLYLLLTENGYEIPQESSIFTFEATEMNDGSGGWWIYGEDHKNYYANAYDSTNTRIVIEKNQSERIKSFNKLNYKTWKPK